MVGFLFFSVGLPIAQATRTWCLKGGYIRGGAIFHEVSPICAAQTRLRPCDSGTSYIRCLFLEHSRCARSDDTVFSTHSPSQRTSPRLQRFSHPKLSGLMASTYDVGSGSGSRLPIAVLIIAGVSTFVAMSVSALSIILQLKNYRKPILQRYVRGSIRDAFLTYFLSGWSYESCSWFLSTPFLLSSPSFRLKLPLLLTPSETYTR